MAKSKEKLKSRQLRRKGESIKKIANSLGVSPSSVSFWVKDIRLTQKQIETLRKRQTDPFYGKRLDYYLKKKKEFEKKILFLKNKGVKEIGSLSKRDTLLVGIALYWGEGFKKDHQVGLASSDVNISRFFVYWLKEVFDISHKDLILRVTANISYRNRINKLEKFWSKALAIPLNQFSKPYFQKSVWKKQYENKNDYHGVLRIKVKKSVDLLRKIFGYIEGLSLNIGN
ncbi:hypothetical protein M1328_00985 [Patescibacteria group bacterium]|nr:hypothetical protein [Patescibacteria group bacterium]